MVSNVTNWLADGRAKSLRIAAFCFGFQVVSWFFLFGITAATVGNETITAIMSIVSLIWFFFPLASLVGMSAGFTYQRQHGRDSVAMMGIVLNALWFLGFLLVVFLVVVVGVTA